MKNFQQASSIVFKAFSWLTSGRVTEDIGGLQKAASSITALSPIIQELMEVAQLTHEGLEDFLPKYAIPRYVFGYGSCENPREEHLLSIHWSRYIRLLAYTIQAEQDSLCLHASAEEALEDYTGKAASTAEPSLCCAAYMFAHDYYKKNITTIDALTDIIISTSNPIAREQLKQERDTIRTCIQAFCSPAAGATTASQSNPHAARIFFYIYMLFNPQAIHDALLRSYQHVLQTENTEENQELAAFCASWMARSAQAQPSDTTHPPASPTSYYGCIIQILQRFNEQYLPDPESQEPPAYSAFTCFLKSFLDIYFAAPEDKPLLAALEHTTVEQYYMTLLLLACSCDRDAIRSMLDTCPKASSASPYAPLYHITNIHDTVQQHNLLTVLHDAMPYCIQPYTQSTQDNGQLLAECAKYYTYLRHIMQPGKKSTPAPHSILSDIQDIVHKFMHIERYALLAAIVIIAAIVAMVTIQLHMAHILLSTSLMAVLAGGLCALIVALGVGMYFARQLLPCIIPAIPLWNYHPDPRALASASFTVSEKTATPQTTIRNDSTGSVCAP